MSWFVLFMKRSFDFEGRSCRKEYWMSLLIQVLLFWGIIAVSAIVSGKSASSAFAILFVILMLIPNVSVSVRRLHDLGRSGWWWMVSFIPFGAFALMAFFCLRGVRGENEFGLDPLEAQA